MSRRHPVLFVETIGPDPNLVMPSVRLMEKSPEHPNVTRLRLQFPCWRWGDGAYVDRMRRELVQEALRGPLAGQFQNPVQWFYDPMTVASFAGKMDEIATVYDCMDEHSKFNEAHPELTRRETELLAKADVVFTGGRKLYESKRRHNSNCHFYGCGVDYEHFGRALDAETSVPHDVKALSRPVLGYFGVVDERMDYELVAKLADANPKWSLAIIGPVLKVPHHLLPRRPNIHWLGSRDYSQLPAYCKGFDLCLMPFALNAATEYINPTKALEYMATGRMIVSSAVPDVVSNFSSVVKVASSHEEFVTLCREAVERSEPALIERGLKMAAGNTWDSIVAKMERHIDEALAAKRAHPAAHNHGKSRNLKNTRSQRVKAGAI
ncbi:MAG TPA: glycosyltransferase [Verrucomicrobiae bacterium]|nr:glycosyltransferase [Verrucomicrobiae bacterium]